MTSNQEERLFIAIREDDVEEVSAILGSASSKKEQIGADDWHGGYLRRAVESGSLEVLALLEREGGVLRPHLYEYCLPARRLEVVQYLLAQGVPFDSRPEYSVGEDYCPTDLDLFPRPSDPRSMAIHRLLGGGWRIPDVEGMVDAVRQGDGERLAEYASLQYPLQENRERLYLVACRAGQVELLQSEIFSTLLPQQGEEDLEERGLQAAVESTSLPTLQWCVENCRLVSMESTDSPFAERILPHRPTVLAALCQTVSTKGTVEMCQWLYERIEEKHWRLAPTEAMMGARYEIAIWMIGRGLMKTIPVAPHVVVKYYISQLVGRGRESSDSRLAETLYLFHKLGVRLEEYPHAWHILTGYCTGPGDLSDAATILLAAGVEENEWEKSWDNGRMSVYLRSLFLSLKYPDGVEKMRTTMERVVSNVRRVWEENGLSQLE